MTASAKIVMMSHLSDIQGMMTWDFVSDKDQQDNSERINTKLDFVKYMISNLLGSPRTEQGEENPNYLEIDPDMLYTEFLEQTGRL